MRVGIYFYHFLISKKLLSFLKNQKTFGEGNRFLISKKLLEKEMSRAFSFSLTLLNFSQNIPPTFLIRKKSMANGL